MYEQASREWEPLQGPPAAELAQARLQAHWALQSVAAVGAAVVPPRPDDSHAATSWIELRRSLAGEATPGGHRAALRLEDLTALLMDGDGSAVERQSLAGRTLQDALSWFAGALEKHEGQSLELALPTYDLPQHPTAAGAAFQPASAQLELARWYANASRFLEAVRADHGTASPVRCWPHHFDIATLITLDAARDPEHARSIGVGLSPGDASIAEPYFYVNPWPPPSPERLPRLDGPGTWHTEGWVGAVLPASGLLAVAPQEQPRKVATHLDSAMAACRTALGQP